MAHLSDDFIEEVRSRNDIVEVISGYVRLQRRGSNYFGLCPFHGEKTASFSVSPAKQMYYCFGCGAGGNVITFIMEYENFTFMEALKQLAERVGMEMPQVEFSEEAKRQADKKAKLLEINKVAAYYYYSQLSTPNGKIGLDYLQNRQLKPETIRKFGLGYSLSYSDDLYRYLKEKSYSDEDLKDSGLIQIDEKRGGHDKFWNRVMFPIMDVNNHVIGFGGRVMGDGMPKYMNSPETAIFDKSRNLYGLNLARTSRENNLILCEGYMDVISLHQAGFHNAAASLGTALTPGHARLLKRYTDEVLLCYDSDSAGVKAAMRAIPILKEAGLTAKVIHMDPYKDPDEFIKGIGAEAFQERIQKAQNSFLFEISILEKDYDLSDPESKTKFYNEIAKRLLTFSEELERENYMKAVANQYQMGYENLQKLVNKLGMTGGLVTEVRKVHKSPEDRRKKEDGMLQSQKLLLTWLVEDTSVFVTVKEYISPEDFDGEMYYKVAKALFEQLKSGQANPAKIVSMFAKEEEQRQAASMFNAALFDDMTREEKEKALKETILRMKQRSIERHSKEMNPTDMVALMQVIEDKRNLESLEKLHISIN